MNEILSLSPDNYETRLSENILAVDTFINRKYLAALTDCDVIELPAEARKTNSIRFFRINKIVFDEKENINDKLISVYGALQDIQASIVMLIRGTEIGIEFYLGVDADNVSIAEKTFIKSFKANFPGSTSAKISNAEVNSILSSATFAGEECNVSSITVLPSPRDEDKEKFVQGIEKFIDTMTGETFSALIVSRPVSKEESDTRRLGLEQLYTALSPFSKTTLAYGENESTAVSEGVFENFSHTVNESLSKTFGTNSSVSKSKNKGTSTGINMGFSYSTNSGESTTVSEGSSFSRSNTSGTADTIGSGTNKTETGTVGTNKNTTIETINKTVEQTLKNIDQQLERIKACEAFGIWETAAYFIAEEIQDSIVAANAFKALVLGEDSDAENSYTNIWNIHNPNTPKIVDYMRYCKHPVLKINANNDYPEHFVTPGNLISGKELPLLVGLPRKSVNGVSVTTMAEFSRNVYLKDETTLSNPQKKLPLGCIHHMGVDDTGNIVNLDINSLTSHCFITGSTGSGKSNTSYYILQSLYKNKIPFLVIEPAKGEYRQDIGGMEGINVFTTNPYMGAMLKINPFEFNPKIHILEHLDRLIEIFNACWEMYAAMPAILKNAVEKAYISKGWDLVNSVYLKTGEPQYPTFSDLLTILPKIIKNSGYSSDTQGDYTGALVTRVESLTNGITGQIFCDNYYIDDKVLFDETTIIDLSRIGSSETKSLIMGIIVMRLNEYRIANAEGTNKELRHVTVLEEAHNLLKNVSQGQGQQSANPVGKSVEMICNSIAEMRTYGEGFIIIDQSPSSVDIAAIKNTNTKIIMRLPEFHDCETAGRSIGLKDEQIAELAKLPVGVAAVMQNNWLEAALCKISRASDKYKAEIEPCTFEQVKAVRSAVISTLFVNVNKYLDVETGSSELRKKLTEVHAPEYLKTEAVNRARSLYNMATSTFNPDELDKFLYHFLTLQHVFRNNEEIISGQEINATEVEQWKLSMLSALKSIVQLQNDYWYKIILSYTTKYLALEHSKGVNYSEIFNRIR